MKKNTSKKSAAAERRAIRRVECVDGLHDCLMTVTALANLLEASGRHPQAELLQPDMVSRTGYLILGEMRKAAAWVDELDEAQYQEAR